MKSLKNDPALAELPPPISLTPEQLAAVASDTSAMLGAGGGLALSKFIIAGGFPTILMSGGLGPIANPASLGGKVMGF